MENISWGITRTTTEAIYIATCHNVEDSSSRRCKCFKLAKRAVKEMRSFFKCICEDEFPGNTVKPIRTAEYDILPEVNYTMIKM